MDPRILDKLTDRIEVHIWGTRAVLSEVSREGNSTTVACFTKGRWRGYGPVAEQLENGGAEAARLNVPLATVDHELPRVNKERYA